MVSPPQRRLTHAGLCVSGPCSLMLYCQAFTTRELDYIEFPPLTTFCLILRSTRFDQQFVPIFANLFVSFEGRFINCHYNPYVFFLHSSSSSFFWFSFNQLPPRTSSYTPRRRR